MEPMKLKREVDTRELSNAILRNIVRQERYIKQRWQSGDVGVLCFLIGTLSLSIGLLLGVL